MVSRDSVSKREEGEKAASRMSESKNTGSRDTVQKREEGRALAQSISEKSSSREPVRTPPSSSGSRDTVQQRAAGTRTAQSMSSGGGSGGQSTRATAAPNQSTMRAGGFDQLMRELDAGTTRRSAPNLTDPGQIDALIGGLQRADIRAKLTDPSRVQTAGFSIPGFEAFLDDAARRRAEKVEERRAQGIEPSPGIIDWNAINNDIGKALGGIGDVFAAPAPRLVEPPRTRQDIPTNMGGYAERGTYVDPETGLAYDMDTGAWYDPQRLPETFGLPEQTSMAALPAVAPASVPASAAPPAPAVSPIQVVENIGDAFGGLGNLAAGINAERERMSPPATPSREDPYYQPEMPPSTSAPPSEVIAEPTSPGKKTDEEPSVWDKAVDMAGGALGNTLVGGVVKTLFPDFWDSAGETLKGNSPSGSLAPVGYAAVDRWGAQTDPRETISSYGGLEGFIDMNGNGIDDRVEGYVAPAGLPVQRPGMVAPMQINYSEAVFPDMPPYRPGVDAEWKYFRPRAYAEGGLVEAVAAESPNGAAPTSGLDPRITIIADAEDALTGDHPNPDEALGLFVQTFGPDALEMLKAQVKSGMTLRGHQRKTPRMAKGRFVEGEGGGTDDAVPARIDEVEEARLSNGEYVLTADAVRGAGGGDPMKGAAKLSALDAALAGHGDDSLDVERVR